MSPSSRRRRGVVVDHDHRGAVFDESGSQAAEEPGYGCHQAMSVLAILAQPFQKGNRVHGSGGGTGGTDEIGEDRKRGIVASEDASCFQEDRHATAIQDGVWLWKLRGAYITERLADNRGFASERASADMAPRRSRPQWLYRAARPSSRSQFDAGSCRRDSPSGPGCCGPRAAEHPRR